MSESIEIRLTNNSDGTLTVEHINTGQRGEFWGSVAEFQAEADHFGENVRIVEVV